MRNVKKTVLVAATALLVAGQAHAQRPVIEVGPALVQQTLDTLHNYETMVTTIEDLANQGEQLATQISIMERVLRDGTPVSGAEWAQFENRMGLLAGVARRGQALAYEVANVDTAFRTAFPGYEPPVDWPGDYARQSAMTLDTLAGVLASVGANVADAPEVQGSLNTLRTENESAVGQLAAAQTANRIASLQIGELVKMRQLMVAHTNALTVFHGQQLQKETASEAAFQAFVGGAPSVRDYGAGGFRTLPSVCARPPCP